MEECCINRIQIITFMLYTKIVDNLRNHTTEKIAVCLGKIFRNHNRRTYYILRTDAQLIMKIKIQEESEANVK